MKLHCLGTTGFHPSPTRHTACYYLPDVAVVLDAGTGIFRLVQHLLDDPKESITIFLSHAHLDHVVGLTFLVDALAVTALKSIRLVGDPEKLDTVREHLYNRLLFPVEPQMEFVALEGESGSMDLAALTAEEAPGAPATVEWFPLEHPGGSLGFCFQFDQRKLAYVTDTVADANADYADLIQDCTLLLHECYFGDEHEELAKVTGHSWLSEVEKVVKKTHPQQTALIHINPLAETLGNEFTLTNHQRKTLNMLIATDELVLEF